MPEHKQQDPNSSIMERLVRVETKLGSVEDQVKEGFDQLHGCINVVGEKVDGVNRKTDGVINGDLDRPGILIRIALLEADKERRRWFNRLVVGAIVTLFVGGAYSALT